MFRLISLCVQTEPHKMLLVQPPKNYSHNVARDVGDFRGYEDKVVSTLTTPALSKVGKENGLLLSKRVKADLEIECKALT